MDKTEQFIKMCEKAEEIQLHSQSAGDFYCVEGEVEVAYEDSFDGYTWLPRQDDLQKMVGDWWKKNGEYGQPLIKGLYDFAMSFNPQPFRESELPISSWEQLWLAFYMSEKYGKVWSGTEWIKK